MAPARWEKPSWPSTSSTRPGFPADTFNWDYGRDRQDLLAEKWHRDDDLIVLDELHKYRDWKNWIKGIYDTQKDHTRFLVTGSARLDVYRQGGDSLLGRYHYWRLHPFGLDEFPEKMTAKEAFERLMAVGGFPEPFLDGDPRKPEDGAGTGLTASSRKISGILPKSVKFHCWSCSSTSCAPGWAARSCFPTWPVRSRYLPKPCRTGWRCWNECTWCLRCGPIPVTCPGPS
ncbi:MAG: AAA family ATPase [Desulfotignum sp.]|nr:AAA family ATPase [Desulfotignum sp.]